jgi:hypothetical protein
MEPGAIRRRLGIGRTRLTVLAKFLITVASNQQLHFPSLKSLVNRRENSSIRRPDWHGISAYSSWAEGGPSAKLS